MRSLLQYLGLAVRPLPPKPRFNPPDAILQADTFEAWLYEVIGERSLDWKEVWTFIHSNSERLERECAWINQDKEVVAERQAVKQAVLAYTYAERTCPFCHAHGADADRCTMCFGEYAK